MSEGVVALTRGLQGPGLRVHRAERDEYLTLYVTRCADLDAYPVNEEQDPAVDTVRVTIGQQTTALVVEAGDVVPNLPVSAGEEVWIAASRPRRYAAYGVATSTPMPTTVPPTNQ